jgi:hypothetical protein
MDYRIKKDIKIVQRGDKVKTRIIKVKKEIAFCYETLLRPKA